MTDPWTRQHQAEKANERRVTEWLLVGGAVIAFVGAAVFYLLSRIAGG